MINQGIKFCDKYDFIQAEAKAQLIITSLEMKREGICENTE